MVSLGLTWTHLASLGLTGLTMRCLKTPAYSWGFKGISLKPQQNSRENARRRRGAERRTSWRRQPQRLEQHCLTHLPAPRCPSTQLLRRQCRLFGETKSEVGGVSPTGKSKNSCAAGGCVRGCFPNAGPGDAKMSSFSSAPPPPMLFPPAVFACNLLGF